MNKSMLVGAVLGAVGGVIAAYVAMPIRRRKPAAVR
ncbi:uncharacterized protein YcfJ [Azomonas macrocytogenes]|uniref:Uncharacterized protein YcfJ n=1 Tax=Azomonas macrocytogenes TaxID=69962 RepID=A0A839SYY8_AZOMA|nr:uncharacterized protein YcfJ [Azomonas macrocytogenes]